MNQKLELIKHKAEVNNLKIETNLFQRTNEVHACTRKYIFLVEILQKLWANLFGFCSLLELLNQNL